MCLKASIFLIRIFQYPYAGWTDYLASGTPASERHSWNDEGNFIIEAKAKDIYGFESDWGTLEIEMPRNKVVMHKMFQLFKDFFCWFSILNRVFFQ